MSTRIRRLAFEAVRQAHHWPRRVGLSALAVLLLSTVLTRAHLGVPYLSTAAWLVLIGVTAWWLWSRLLKPLSTAEWLQRRDEWLARNQGTASGLDILEVAGRGAMRRRAKVMRPSLAGLSWWALRRVPVTEFCVPLGRAGWFTVHSSAETWTLRLGAPRMGKSGSLAAHALDAPGALVVTSTRLDLLRLTGPVREQRGRVHVFNPGAEGGYRSTVRWSLLVDCEDYATCQRRAADLIPESTGEGARWDAQARRLLAMLLHAAALSGKSVGDIVGWIAHAGAATADEVSVHLAGSRSAVALMREARQTFTTNDRTLTSITTTLMVALSWVADATAAAIGDAPVDHPDLIDIRSLVRSTGDSLYLISPEKAGTVGPLVGALTAEIAYQARLASSERPGERLDPPLTLCLDEVAKAGLTIPLHQWSADMGGRGVTGHVSLQSLAQLRDLWGETGAETILTNCGGLLVFGGIKGATDLERLATLTGRRKVQLDEDDARFVEVLTPAEISTLPEGKALLVVPQMPAAVVDVPFEAWKRRDVRRAFGTSSAPRVEEPPETDTAGVVIPLPTREAI